MCVLQDLPVAMIDRRAFMHAALSSLLAYPCSFARARAGAVNGCRMAALDDTSRHLRSREKAPPTLRAAERGSPIVDFRLRVAGRPSCGVGINAAPENVARQPGVIAPAWPIVVEDVPRTPVARCPSHPRRTS